MVISCYQFLCLFAQFYIKCHHAITSLNYASHLAVVSAVRQSLVLAGVYYYECLVPDTILSKHKRYPARCAFCHYGTGLVAKAMRASRGFLCSHIVCNRDYAIF